MSRVLGGQPGGCVGREEQGRRPPRSGQPAARAWARRWADGCHSHSGVRDTNEAAHAAAPGSGTGHCRAGVLCNKLAHARISASMLMSEVSNAALACTSNLSASVVSIFGRSR